MNVARQSRRAFLAGSGIAMASGLAVAANAGSVWSLAGNESLPPPPVALSPHNRALLGTLCNLLMPENCSSPERAKVPDHLEMALVTTFTGEEWNNFLDKLSILDTQSIALTGLSFANAPETSLSELLIRIQDKDPDKFLPKMRDLSVALYHGMGA